MAAEAEAEAEVAMPVAEVAVAAEEKTNGGGGGGPGGGGGGKGCALDAVIVATAAVMMINRFSMHGSPSEFATDTALGCRA